MRQLFMLFISSVGRCIHRQSHPVACWVKAIIIVAGSSPLVHASTDDLVLGYAGAFSGGGFGRGWSMALDSAGNRVISGDFYDSQDCDPGPGTFNLTSGGSPGAFVCKLDPSGSLLWAAALGGDAHGQDVAIDSADNVYVTGEFYGTGDFDPGPGVLNLSDSGGRNTYICKLDTAGALVWGVSVGGAGQSIAIDGAGNVYVTGYFAGTSDFDPGAGVFNLTSAGSGDVFACKLSSSGEFQWAVRIGGSEGDHGYDVAVDGAGNVHLTGRFADTVDFNPGSGTFTLSAGANECVFVCKLDTSGLFQWARSLRDVGSDNGLGIAVDATGNSYSTGYFQGTADFDPGAGTFNLTSAGSPDAFLWKLDAAGAFLWARQLGGSETDAGYSPVLDWANNVYLVGSFEDRMDFDPGPGFEEAVSAGRSDAFVWKLDESGELVWAGTMGGGNIDEIFGCAIDPAGNLHITGSFRASGDYDPGPGNFELVNAGSGDVSIIKLEPQSLPLANPDMGDTLADTTLVTLTVPSANTLTANDADANTLATLIVTAFDITSARGAVVVVNSDGTFTYDPTTVAAFQVLAPDESLMDTFTYTISDGIDSATGTVTVEVFGKGTGLPATGAWGILATVAALALVGRRYIGVGLGRAGDCVRGSD